MCRDCFERTSTRGAKSNGPVSVTEPGAEMAPIFSTTDVRREVVSPVSESWNCAAMTAMAPSVFVLVGGFAKFIKGVGWTSEFEVRTSSFVHHVHFQGEIFSVNGMLARRVEMELLEFESVVGDVSQWL